MKSSVMFLVGGLISAVIAMPTANGGGGDNNYVPCSGLYSNAQCCDTDVLGVADLDCAAPLIAPTSAANFVETCAAEGKINVCCVVPVLDQALLCKVPSA